MFDMGIDYLSDIGEAEIIRYLTGCFESPKESGLGIGDDGAVLVQSSPIVAVADSMIEDVHFSLAFSAAREVGEKLIAVNVSDVAAMGAAPTSALFTFSAPKSLEWAWARDLIDGVADGARKYGLSVVGGDVTSSPGPVALSLTLLGSLYGEIPLRRDAAQPGEILYVTGTLGDAALGLQALMTGSPDPKVVPNAVQALHLPTARLDEGRKLAVWDGCNCAMDISDGLFQDASRLAQASGVDMAIELSNLPINAEVLAMGSSAESYALSGGEDYELLFTAKEQPPFPAVAIGVVSEGNGQVTYTRNGMLVEPNRTTYSHF
jgi:thiamine-monophosphate kinase